MDILFLDTAHVILRGQLCKNKMLKQKMKGENTMNKWEVLKNIDLGTVDRDSLVDIDDVVIDESLSKEERIRSYIRQIKNPYCFKCGSVVVKVSYAEDGEPLETIMERLILSL